MASKPSRDGFFKLAQLKAQSDVVESEDRPYKRQWPSCAQKQAQASRGSFLILLLSYHLLFSRVSSLAQLAAAVLRLPHASPGVPWPVSFLLRMGGSKMTPKEEAVWDCVRSPQSPALHTARKRQLDPHKLRTDPRARLFPVCCSWFCCDPVHTPSCVV